MGDDGSRMSLPPTLIEVLADRLVARRYSPRTVEAYTYWVRGFVRFCNRRHPRNSALRTCATTSRISRAIAR